MTNTDLYLNVRSVVHRRFIARHWSTIILLFLLLGVVRPALAQQAGEVLGRVIDAETKQPLTGANVVVTGTTAGAATDANGHFVIAGLGDGVYKLAIQYIGYEPHVVTDVRVVRGKTTRVAEVELTPALLLEGEVTVTVSDVLTIQDMPVSIHTYGREEIRRNPGGAGGVLRALDGLPGVSTSGGEFSAFSVRGGSPRDNLVLVDNIPFDKISHFEGGSEEQEAEGGRFSIFTSGLVEDAEFSAGGFAPKYGRKGASVLDLELKEGNTESYTLNGSYDLMGWETNYDGPLHDLGRTGLVVNVRKLDLSRPLKLIDREDYGVPRLADALVKTTTHLDGGHKVSVLGLYSADDYKRTAESIFASGDLVENDVWDIEEARYLLGLNGRWMTGTRSFVRTTLYARGNDRASRVGRAWADGRGVALPDSRAGLTVREGIANADQEELEVGLRTDFTFVANRTATLATGFELYHVDLDYGFRQNGVDTLYTFHRSAFLPDPAQKYLVVTPEMANSRFEDGAVHAGAYANYAHTLRGRLTLDAGLRYDYTGFNEEHTIAPRLRASLRLDRHTLVNAAVGLYYQPPLYADIAAHPANLDLDNERSVHLIGGLTRQLRSDLRLTVEGYYKQLDRLVIQPHPLRERRTNDGDGWATGVDAIVLKRFTGRYYGQLSYSYSVSRRDDQDGFGGYDGDFSQPHLFSALVGYEINSEWFVSAKWKYATGRPKDAYVVHADVHGDPDLLRFSKEVTGRNADRLPDFHILNLRVDYRKQLGRIALVTFLDIYNAYSRSNPTEARFSELNGRDKPLSIGVLGTGGVKIEI